jgi:hypothetical protein
MRLPNKYIIIYLLLQTFYSNKLINIDKKDFLKSDPNEANYDTIQLLLVTLRNIYNWRCLRF